MPHIPAMMNSYFSTASKNVAEKRRRRIVSATSTASICQSRVRGRSIHRSQWCVLLISIKKFRNTIIRNVPPNAATSWCTAVSAAEYASGLSIAIRRTSILPSQVVTLTMSIGNISRIPKTAIGSPKTRNARLHHGSQFSSIFAFTTALSSEREVSRTDSIATIDTPRIPSSQ